MSITVKICTNDVTWRTGTFTAKSSILDIDKNAMLIWSNGKRIFDVSNPRLAYALQTTFQELDIKNGAVLYVFNFDFKTPNGDVSTIVPADIKKIMSFAQAASTAFNSATKQIKDERNPWKVKLPPNFNSLIPEDQAKFIIDNMLRPGSFSEINLRESAKAIHINLKRKMFHFYANEFPDIVEKFRANPNIAFEEIFDMFMKYQYEEIKTLYLPDSELAKKKIEDEKNRKLIDSQYFESLNHHPENMIPVTMLYINLSINGCAVKAFVDSGAQVSLMSLACAERCKLTGLIDRRFRTTTRGVGGTEHSVGQIHLCDVKVETAHFICPFQVMANREMDLLIGLNVLRQHRCSINLSTNRLEFPGGINTPFLEEREINSHLVSIEAIAAEPMENEEPSSSSTQQ